MSVVSDKPPESPSVKQRLSRMQSARKDAVLINMQLERNKSHRQREVLAPDGILVAVHSSESSFQVENPEYERRHN